MARLGRHRSDRTIEVTKLEVWVEQTIAKNRFLPGPVA